MQLVQQSGGASVAQLAPAERSQIKPDAAPGIPSAQINEKWDRVLRAMYKYSKTSPDVMRYFRVQRVEGNTVYLCTDNEVYYKRIQPYPEKRQIIEKALVDVFQVQMIVQVVLVSGGDLAAMNSGAPQGAPVDSGDSLLSTGIELGAEIKKLDTPSSAKDDDHDDNEAQEFQEG